MKKIKLLIAIFVCLFVFTSLVACNNPEQNGDNNNQEVETGGSDQGSQNQGNQNQGNQNQGNQGNENQGNQNQGGSTINVDKAELNDTTEYYTGEAIAFLVKNLPGGVKVDYTYTLDGVEVTEMVEIGVYQVTAVISDKSTGEELRTLTATLTIEAKPIVDEVPNDADSNMELTYETTYVQFHKDPDDETRLIAAGLELYAEETIYFVLDRDPSWTTENFPLEFLLLDPASVECATLVGNAVVISEQGTYDVIMSFPEGQLQPTILVREGQDSSVFYFRGTMNEYGISEEYTFAQVEGTNTVEFETELAVGDVFVIANYYYSVSFKYDPYFLYMPMFAAGGEYNTDVKVQTAGTYKFVIDLSTKLITIYKDGTQVIADKDMLFFRGTMNNYDTSTPLIKENGVASIEIALNADDVFAIADANWGVQYNYNNVKAMTAYFAVGGEYGTDIKVLQAGTYRFEIDLVNHMITVYKDGELIGESEIETTVTIYFSNNKKWSGDIYAYVWNSSDDSRPAEWPGIKMNWVETNEYGEDVYSVQVDSSLYNMIIFTNGSNQSNDSTLSKTNNTGYYITEDGNTATYQR